MEAPVIAPRYPTAITCAPVVIDIDTLVDVIGVAEIVLNPDTNVDHCVLPARIRFVSVNVLVDAVSAINAWWHWLPPYYVVCQDCVSVVILIVLVLETDQKRPVTYVYAEFSLKCIGAL